MKNNDSDRMGDFISWLYKKEDLYGYLFKVSGKFFDIGSIEGYEEARRVLAVIDKEKNSHNSL